MKFISIYQDIISEAIEYYDPKFMGQTLKVKDKLPKKLADIAGKTLLVIDKPATGTKVIELVGSASHAKSAYVIDDSGIVYKLFNQSPAPFSIYSKGGKKVNLGAKAANIHESAICHFLVLALKSKWSSPEDIMEYISNTNELEIANDLQSGQDRYQTTSVANESALLVKEDSSWAKSTAAICARLLKEFKFSSSTIFHRGSALTDSIDSKGLDLCNKAGAGFGTKKDKWNPSDIWAINKSSKSVKEILNSVSIQELNSILDSNLEVGKYKDIFGISLKKSGYPKANLKYMNMDNVEFPKGLKADTIETGKNKQKGITKTTDIHDTGNNIQIQLRSSAGNRLTTISGIIAGKEAQHGSVTITQLFKHNKVTFPKLSKDPKYYFTDIGESTPQFYSELQKLINEVIMNAKRIGVNKLIGFIFTIKNKADLDKFMISTLQKHKGNTNNATAALYSKLQGLYLASIMKEDTLEVAYYTASAQKTFSPKFVKVGE
tara:strand:- start:15132 stop:16604 length:1473 start_codon:yes stop_codon:yes gene_type:complete